MQKEIFKEDFKNGLMERSDSLPKLEVEDECKA